MAKSLWRRVASAAPRHWIAEWAVNLVVLLFGMTTLVQGFVIPSGSMENGLLVGDHVFVDKLVYAPPGALTRHLLPYRDVRRGDIIVFRYPLDITQNYVKRAIGLPGDRIRIVNKQVILNEVPLTEPYVVHKFANFDRYRDSFPGQPNFALNAPVLEMLEHHVFAGEVVVPPGHYFAMGDNRDNSWDSRYWGFVPRENIIGTPLLVYWSYDAPEEELTEPGLGLDHAVDVALHFFTKTRWSRMFHLVRGYPLP